ncbi:DUF4365 domain-containing protein [Pseudoalteromonas sp. OOF1S-7]|uniref:DUF4365 domain-containing protein n=1 Tax=Pseudoalteromonas sp. OOF1S-7 TaxID=2917757 RepID=UPI001EF6D81F|nr:DUF4365 domain-containing protein [Pseudoalteromonas sp. OOF1S-7]MCG7537393.1 DUF4365 domain-containing protein [Pseudoalteromonas sp. OOF1S-7]
MKFDIKASHGKAGEFYFSYWICNFFGWPCRLLDIDVGIDAQIELFDEKNHSLGMFIGAQVKTSQGNEPNVQVKLNNLEYWASIEDPVILVSITLDEEPKIYWKLINDGSISGYIDKAKSNASGKVQISFSPDNEIDVTDKAKFKSLIYMKQASVLDAMCINFNIECDTLSSKFLVDGEIEADPVSLQIDLCDLEDYISRFDSFFGKFDAIEYAYGTEVKNLSTQYANTKYKFNVVKMYISCFIGVVKDIDVDYGFEIRKQWMVSGTNRTLYSIFEEKYPEY